MPRKYDCVVRFYSSWFADLTNESKGFSYEEIGQILLKIAEAQIQKRPELVQELPITIKRGLQMATLEEQITRLIERSENCKARGSIGGQVTAQRAASQAQAEKIERDRRLGLERMLENEQRDRRRKKESYDVALYQKVCEIANMEPWEAARADIDIRVYRQVFEEDVAKGKLQFPEWLIYHRLMEIDKVKKLYKDFLKQ